MRLKLISGIFISLCAVILMSHNAGALGSYVHKNWGMATFVTNVNNGNMTYAYCNETSNPAWFNYLYTTFDHSRLGVGAYYLVAFTFSNANDNNSLDAMIPTTWNPRWSDYAYTVETEIVNNSPTSSTLYIVIYVTGTPSGRYLDFYSQQTLRLNPNECLDGYGWLVNIDYLKNPDLSGISNQLGIINNSVQQLLNSNPNGQNITNILNESREISDGIDDLNTSVENRNRAEFDAVDNINDQTPSDIGNTDSPQTTSLLNTIGNFIGALGNLSATNCIVDLNFPQFAGGTQRVNVCQNKEYTGNIVQVAGSIFVVVFYIPIAFMLLSKIYNEIKSFTNG